MVLLAFCYFSSCGEWVLVANVSADCNVFQCLYVSQDPPFLSSIFLLCITLHLIPFHTLIHAFIISNKHIKMLLQPLFFLSSAAIPTFALPASTTNQNVTVGHIGHTINIPDPSSQACNTKQPSQEL
ncbi:hypothetical protein ABVK25_006957 [Lepraria finkii]|uniref:Uncharacterized protein n=1 Tax=Lepraria finkii TaxID=1340010 RepID=A0ABR4B4B4_9LECA